MRMRRYAFVGFLLVLGLLAGGCVFGPKSGGPVPEAIEWAGQGWVARDFNAYAIGSTWVDDDGRLVIRAAGHDLWFDRDGFRFVYQKVTGDFTATVRLHSVPDTDPWAKAGLMVRSEERATSAYVALLGTHHNGLTMQVRSAPGEGTGDPGKGHFANGEPLFLQLTREGNRVTGRTSHDGVNWTEIHTVELELPEGVFVGLAATSHAETRLGDAVFSEWTLE